MFLSKECFKSNGLTILILSEMFETSSYKPLNILSCILSVQKRRMQNNYFYLRGRLNFENRVIPILMHLYSTGVFMTLIYFGQLCDFIVK
jgi:hypothetical protein